ncbi:MAG: hypothetical protein WC551_13275, partial [Patescibacteria group bacterium]
QATTVNRPAPTAEETKLTQTITSLAQERDKLDAQISDAQAALGRLQPAATRKSAVNPNLPVGLELHKSAQPTMEEIYSTHIISVDSHGRTRYIPANQMAANFPYLAEVYKNDGNVMKLAADGSVDIRYYFGEELEGSHAVVQVVKADKTRESRVFELDAEGRAVVDLGESIDKGVVKITDTRSPGMVKRVRVYENPAPIGLIGVDGWGKTIVTAYDDKIVVNMGETFADAQRVDPALARLGNIPQNATASRIFNVENWKGQAIEMPRSAWAFDLGSYSLSIPDQDRTVKFHYIYQASPEGQLLRQFGIDTREREMKIKFDGQIFEVPRSGGADTYLVKKAGDREFIAVNHVSTSNSMLFGELPHTWGPRIETIGDQIAAFLPGADVPAFRNLVWVKITMIGENGKPVSVSYQGFRNKDKTGEAAVKVTDDGFADIVFTQNKSKLSLRYDLDDANFMNPNALSYYVSDTQTLVVDFYKRLVFMEQKDGVDKFITSKWHIRMNGIEFDVFAPNSQASLNKIIDYLKTTQLKNGNIKLPAHMTVERQEFFEYKDTTMPWRGQQIVYPGVLLKVFEIPSLSTTRYLVPNNGQPLVGVGELQEINWDEKYIKSSNKVIFYTTDVNVELGRMARTMWRDFKGNVFIQQEKDNTTTYVFGFDHHGVGERSLTTAVDRRGEVVINIASLYLDKTIDQRFFTFLTAEGVLYGVDGNGQKVALSPTQLFDNYRKLQNVRVSYADLRNIPAILKDGQGHLRYILSDYRGDLGALMTGATGLKEWVNKVGTDDLFSHFNEITIIEETKDITSAYDAGAMHLGYGKGSHTYTTRFDGRVPVLEKEQYKNDKFTAQTDNLRIVLADENDKDSPILFVYDIKDTRKGRELAQQIYVSSTGNLARAINANPKVRVVVGQWGYAIKGTETVTYDVLGNPVQATDSQGRVIKEWQNIRYEAHEDGGIREIHTMLKSRELAPHIKDNDRLILRNGNFEDESMFDRKTLEPIFKYWQYVVIPVAGFIGMMVLGVFLGRARVNRLVNSLTRKGSSGRASAERTGEPVAGTADVDAGRPSFADYGFDEQIVLAARHKFAVIESRLERGESPQVVIDEYFQAYRVWRETVWGDKVPQPMTIEDLWLFFLVNVGAGYFHSDTPALFNYFLHKAVTLRDNTVGSIIREEYERWYKILSLTLTAFKGIGPTGEYSNIVPYQELFSIDDLEEMFRTPKFVKYYDGMERADRVDQYNALIERMKPVSANLVNKLKELDRKYGVDSYIDSKKKWENEIKRINEDIKKAGTSSPASINQLKVELAIAKASSKQAEKHENNLGKTDRVDIKKKLAGTAEFKEFKKFFHGEWSKDKPLLFKTYPDTIGYRGMWDVAGWLHTLRNFYQPVSIISGVILVALFAVLLFGGKITLVQLGLVAIAIAAINWTIKKGLDLALKRSLDKKVKTSAYGRPVRPDTGYQKAPTPLKTRLFRIGFWTALIAIKIVWNYIVFNFALLAHYELAGAAWVVLGLNINGLLIFGLWAPFALFFLLDTFSLFYLFEAVVGHIYGKHLGLGIIKSEGKKEALRKIRVANEAGHDDFLVALIKKRFVPAELRLTPQQQDVVVAEIVNLTLDNLLIEDGITLEEYNRNKWGIARNGNDFFEATVTPAKDFFSDFRNEKIRLRMYRHLNSLLMDMPDMPVWEKIRTLTMLIPVGPGEGFVYEYQGELEKQENTGLTALTYLISRNPDKWENFINRMEREGKASQEELERMGKLKLRENLGKRLGDVNPQLEWEIRLWGSCEFQPFVRTLRGVMHYAQVLRLYARMNHPEWSDERISEEVQKKFQMLWGHQAYADYKKDKHPRAHETLLLVQYFYEKAGYLIDIASLPKRDGFLWSVLSRYDPASGDIKDIYTIKLTEDFPIVSEGKPGNQTHTRRYARGEVVMTLDINQDFYVEQTMKIPHLLTLMDDPEVGIVGYPEDIFTDDYSLIGKFHAIADRTFNSLVQRVLTLLGARFHYGHPDIWRASCTDMFGGVSSSYAVNEDIYGGYGLTMRGRGIKYVEWIEAGKAREVSWATTDGIFRKFGMGATQQAYNRFIYYLFTSHNFGVLQRLSHLFGGIGFYLRKPWVVLGLFGYVTFAMLMGVSGFAPFPAAILFALVGLVIFGQAITFTGFMQAMMDRPAWEGAKYFLKTFLLMSPFYMAHVFTNAIGVSLAQKGFATYVATGRGFMLNHASIAQISNGFGKSNIVKGFLATLIAGYGISVWFNPTLWWSAPFVLMALAAMAVPFVSNRGYIPMSGITAQTVMKLWVEDLKDFKGLMVDNIREARRDKFFDVARAWNVVIHAVTFVVWFAMTIVPVILTWLMGGFSAKDGKNMQIKALAKDKTSLDIVRELRSENVSSPAATLDSLWSRASKSLQAALLEESRGDVYKAKMALFNEISKENVARALETVDREVNEGFLAANIVAVRRAEKGERCYQEAMSGIWAGLPDGLRLALLDANQNDVQMAQLALFLRLKVMMKDRAAVVLAKKLGKAVQGFLASVNLNSFRFARTTANYSLDVILQSWERVDASLKQALEDVNGQNAGKARKAFFDAASAENKRQTRERIPGVLLSAKLEHLLAVPANLEALRRMRQSVAPILRKLAALAGDKVAVEELD